MKSYEFLRESMSDLAIELEDYKKMSPAEFINAYGLNKQQWYKKYQGVVGSIDQHKVHKAHSYVFHIPGEEPYLNQDLTRHFDTEQEAQKFLNQLRRKHYGVTMNKTN